MSLSARPDEQLSVRRSMGVPLSCQRHPELWISLGVRPAGVAMREMACTRSWSRVAASGAPMSSCQQLESLGLDSVWAQMLDLSCRHLWTYTVPLLDIHPAQPEGEQDEAAGAAFVQLVCVSGWSVQLALMCGPSLCPLWVLTGKLLSLAAGWTWGHADVAASLSHAGLPQLGWFP